MGGKGVSFDPAKDIPSLKGNVILISARNAQIGNAGVTEIKNQVTGVSVNFLEMDLSLFNSIKNAARKFRASVSRLDILLLNAGIMGGPPGVTKEGYECRFGVNHMGHALLFKLLLPLLLKSVSEPGGVKPRIVVTASSAHKQTVSSGIEFETPKSTAENLSTIVRYGQSKMANILFTQELARRYPQFTAVSIHPGTVKTDLFSVGDNGWLIKFLQMVVVPIIGVTIEEGTKTPLWAATATAGIKSGEYYEPIGVAGKGTALSKDKELAKKLWKWTEKELGGHDV
ncbi:uncharacterized protein Z518_09226 [Rhinocladiella mackenziei CBS 650.93]|uniref:Rhinocladiella mackenziei CBS 650.93 unplaced genomic scaffold supercont1.7, whole genome shotgun sequence n=1 Tax=Rhinocladiella mackenziei CBS 650.93 TaxID=1442369 RepID=A0A0D2IY83_9EURO|nr:uncharacterized protein Z518_09226 [Rhinocladiella mackenziei CBS 650.93]KIX01500.1 hypothetical protein Z518_09226 [Rhinocladiella mackenziei CBS 650.93]